MTEQTGSFLRWHSPFMTDYRIVPGRGQRVLMLVGDLVTLGLLVMNVVSGLVWIHPPLIWTVCSVALAVSHVAYIALSFRFTTVLTAHGVIAKGLVTRRIAWDDVVEVEVVRRLGTNGVRLTMADGRKRRLRVPFASSSVGANEFAVAVQAIWERWSVATGRGATYATPQPV